MATGGCPGVAIPCRHAPSERDPSQVALEPLWCCGVMARRFEEEWDAVAVGQIAETYGGLAGKTKADFGTGSARYVSFLDVLENVRITRRRFDRVRIDCSESQHRVRPGDILFNATSETPEDLAMGAVVEVNASDLYLNSFCFGLTIQDRERCDPLFLAYFSRGEPGRTALHKLAQGATRYNLSKRRFLALRLPLPPLPEQRAIAAVLSDADELIRSLEARIAKKRAIKQATTQQLLTGRTRLPGFTGRWERKRLGGLASFLKGKGLAKTELSPSSRHRCVHYGELFTVYGERITEVRHGTDREGQLVYSLCNDVLMPTSDVTPSGLATASCILIPNVIIGGDILIIRAPESVLNGEFLAYAIKTQRAQVMQLVSGTTVFHLYGRDMANFAFSVPPVGEQHAIATVLSDMDAEIDALERRLDKTRAIKQGMMQQLLTGSIRLPIPDDYTEDNPNDA